MKKVIGDVARVVCRARKELLSLKIQTHAATARPAQTRRPVPRMPLVCPNTNQSKPLIV
jgi:hypothetical protein